MPFGRDAGVKKNGAPEEELICSGYGGSFKKDAYRKRQVDTIHGWVAYHRQRYECRGCGVTAYPLDEALGIRRGISFSQIKEQQVLLLSVHMPYADVESVYSQLRGLRASKSAVQRRVQAVGKTLRATAQEIPVSTVRRTGKEHLTADATMVYFRGEGWKEVKVGAHYDVDEERKARNIRYAGTVGPREGLGQRMYDLAGQPSLEQTEGMAFVSDAAPWLEEMQQMHFPRSTLIVDFFHASEYLWDVARTFYGEGSPKGQRWARTKVHALQEGDQRGIRRSLAQMSPKTPDQKESLKKTSRYLTNHGHKMDYPRYEALGFHIGSGIAEAACKHVIQSRFKRAGMRWSHEGAENLLQLRTLYLNRQWNRLSQFQLN